MPGPHAVQIGSVSQEQLGHLRERLTGSGFTCEGEETISCTGRGVDATLSHEAASGTLDIALDASPAIVTPGYLLGKLYDMIDAGPLNPR